MLKRLLPHATLVLSLCALVIWVLDRFNSAMNFMTRMVFKGPLAVLLVLVVIQSLVLIVDHHRR